MEEALFNGSPELHPRNGKGCTASVKNWHRFTAIALLAVAGWLSFVSWSLFHGTSPSPSATDSTSNSVITVTLPLSSQECKSAAGRINAGTPVSLSAADGGIVSGAGTTVFIGAQHHQYGSFSPNHLSVVSLGNDSVLLGLGEYVIVGDGDGDWVSGGTYPFNLSAGAAAPAGWGPFCALPLFVDEIVLLSSANGVALLVAVGGGGALGLRVDLLTKAVTAGDHTSFVKGASIDTDTAAIGPSSFAISYYMFADDESILLMTIAGSVANTLNVTFGTPVSYSPNHMFHQILSLGPDLYALGFPHDNMSETSLASPMGILIASVSTNNVITIWSADGRGGPWIQPYVLGYYFFDMIQVDRVSQSDVITATAAMAVVDRSAADAISVMTFTVSASGNGASGYNYVSCVFGSQLIVTQPGATIGYNYFAMQPLFSLASDPPTSRQAHQRSLKGSVSFKPSTAKNDFAIAWQDTSKQGAVDAVLVSYAVQSGGLALVMPTSQIAPPVPITNSDHWWIAGGALPHGRMMILTTLGSEGNITVVEHLGEVVGLVASSISCGNSPVSVDVSVNGQVKVDPADMQMGAVPGVTVWSTSRGQLVSGTSATTTTSQGSFDLVIGEDGCVGLAAANEGGVWISPDVC